MISSIVLAAGYHTWGALRNLVLFPKRPALEGRTCKI